MTVKEILQSEENITDTVVLHYEGMFWKAYERSAYLFCTQITPFKVTKRFISKLNGTAIVSIGFPDTGLQKYMSKYRLIRRDATTLTYAGFRTLNEQDYLLWKEGHNVAEIKIPALPKTPENPEPRKVDVPYYTLPVYRKTQELYQKITADKVLESIPKATKKRMLEPAINALYEILIDIYEVRELERQLDKGDSPLSNELHRDACRLLLDARRKAARCIVSFRLVFETKVESPYKLLLVPQDLYEEYAEALVSIHHQLSYWSRKHEQLCQ